jgi:SAM-dependent methyltransferase
MPRVLKTIIPRIRRSLKERGVLVSACRSVLLPIHVLREWRGARTLKRGGHRSDFDRIHQVDTDGAYGGWTFLSDLDIPGSSWIDGNDYLPIEPERFARVLASLAIPWNQYTFVDLGSGKGRALLLASRYPFKKITGVEFSPELHRIAEENIRRYRPETQTCRKIESVNLDLADFLLPESPLVLFFFDPCRGRVLADVAGRIFESLAHNPRPLYIAYVSPRAECEALFGSSPLITEICRNRELDFVIYASVDSRLSA